MESRFWLLEYWAIGAKHRSRETKATRDWVNKKLRKWEIRKFGILISFFRLSAASFIVFFINFAHQGINRKKNNQ
jgi:hypothetical protein